MTSAPVRSLYSVLRHLPVEDGERLYLRRVHFAVGERIASRGQKMQEIAFLETGAASLMVSFSDGRQAEAGFLDSESIVGLTALLGDTSHLPDVVMRVAGTAYLCQRDRALEEFSHSPAFQRVVLNSARYQINETTILVGCHAMHEVSQRLARWLLTCQDRTGNEIIFITQEVLSQILGVTRPTISMVSEIFERRALIQVRRGKIRVLDRKALEGHACECYHVLKEYRAQALSVIARVQTQTGDKSVDASDGPFATLRGPVSREGVRRLDRYIQ